jgi:cell division protein FtsQ
MFKKAIWRHILIGFAWATSIGGVIALMSFIETKKADVVCTDVKIYIPGSQYFIDKDEVDNILQVKSNALIGHKLEDINIHALENKLKANPFIEFAKVYMEMDGVIHVEISQRQPILRIVNKFDQDFYIDQHGLKIPLSVNFTAKVLVATGFIDELFTNRVDSLHNDLTKDLFRTADFIRKDSLWSAQIVQIYVNEAHEIELIPRVGNHRILLGNADSLAAKFGNLLVFYKQALPKVGQDAYKIINIKYANQVVGIKNEVMKKDSVKKKDTVAGKDTSDLIKNTTLTQY